MSADLHVPPGKSRVGEKGLYAKCRREIDETFSSDRMKVTGNRSYLSSLVGSISKIRVTQQIAERVIYVLSIYDY